MGFDIYHIDPLDGNRFALKKIGSLPLGGADGLLAKHLPALAGAEGKWDLPPEELLAWAGIADPDSHRIFFDLTPKSTDQLNLMELVNVSGRTVSLITDVLCQFKVACATLKPEKLRGPDGEWIVCDWQHNPNRFEQLRMEGGTRGGNWAWSEPPQAASATVL